ncbi:thioesterase II family protein [Paractinoplanes rishiriensis]|uniref:Thioesterase n=1 Tax=Paractinoplanes rishiriensis TaxID=1050105 RepID=A0A919MY75_9ACTN|nr:thioesterase [Actinoplanes rishiriensis]GIE99519.1 thioesterase [Actinoplanes rishiriensis]
MAGRWSLKPVPAHARRLLFGFPYAGGGASLYRQWPQEVAGSWFCPLQPPGREHRFGEPPVRTHAEFTAALVEFLAGYRDREYSFFGHCGGVPLALSTVLALEDAGLPLPVRVFASGWGAPHRGLYGPLNFVDLRTADLHAEVRGLFRRIGLTARPDVVDIAAANLRVDLELHRPHRYDAARFLPAPVTVIAWSDDDVVPVDQVCDGWAECADVTYHVLPGEHFAFTRCPDALRELFARPAQ